MDVSAAKRKMRREMIVRRASLSGARRKAAAQAIVARFLEVLDGLDEPPVCVSAFWPMGEEPDIRGLLEALDSRGTTVALPVMRGKTAPLAFRQWRPGDALVAAGFGVSEPPSSAPEVSPEVLAVPLLGFDSDGRRLGYGGGYYDRTLHALRATREIVAVGIAYDDQEVDAVPTGPRDERLDVVVTERRTICRQRAV